MSTLPETVIGGSQAEPVIGGSAAIESAQPEPTPEPVIGGSGYQPPTESEATAQADDWPDPGEAGYEQPAEAETTGDEEPFVAEPTRRPRGFLESDVRRITDKLTTGELTLPEGASATPHHIGLLIKQVDGLDEAPSTGAVDAVLKRWVKIGFIETSTEPFAFVGYTQAAVEQGLTALKEAEQARKKAQRAADKAAASSQA